VRGEAPLPTTSGRSRDLTGRRGVSTSPYTARTDDALKVCFAATVGEEPGVDVAVG
jgi:hypothetical protein